MRKVLFIFLCFFLTLLTLCSLFFLPREVEIDKEKSLALQSWHVDCFEGGFGSRSSLLQTIAREYSAKTKVTAFVSNHTIYSAEENFAKGIFPDLISYGNGLNLPYERLCLIKNKEYAMPWCSGGYILISHKGEPVKNLILSKQNYTLPELAIAMQEIKLPIKMQISASKAIYEFYADKSAALLGTQRDLFRIEGKGIDVEVIPITAFNDLYQFISIIGSDERVENSRAFIEFLLLRCNEGGLKKVGMLTADGYLQNSCDSLLNVFDGASFEYTTQPLISKEAIENLRKLASEYEKEEESIKCALKRLK